MCNPAYKNVTLLKLVIDCSALLDINTQSNELSNVELQARRLCFALDCERYKKLVEIEILSRRSRSVTSPSRVANQSFYREVCQKRFKDYMVLICGDGTLIKRRVKT